MKLTNAQFFVLCELLAFGSGTAFAFMPFLGLDFLVKFLGFTIFAHLYIAYQEIKYPASKFDDSKD